MNNLTGLLLCGGLSTRMGSDKGLLNKDGMTWAEKGVHKLNSLDIPVKISINIGQVELYSQLFSSHDLIIDNTHAKGPLNGLLSAHQLFPKKDLFLLACDMTDMSTSTLESLKELYLAEPEFDCYHFVNEGSIEPLCSIYSSSFLDKTNQNLESGNIKQFAMQRLIHDAKSRSLPIGLPNEFNNYNFAFMTGV